MRISPEVVIAIGMNVISPEDDSRSVADEMLACHHPAAGEMDAYERVLGDAMRGDATLFAREDYVEQAWRVVDPVLRAGTPLFDYAPGSWGPDEAKALAPAGGWHDPAT
jgi:glucose-6-phosphate 1-dehydrogenase